MDAIGYGAAPFRFGFIQGHRYLAEVQIREARRILEAAGENEQVVQEYETRFASQIGGGKGISFAAGRMAFFAAMKAFSIAPGDEVILTGSTCSVMPNAVWRIGATPVFSDVDPETFGSDPDTIKAKITPRTKLIVAQHSFGIPCRINEIVEVARKHGIPVIEDCAITLGTSIKGKRVGNYGDAAIFSTDHTKPLNTIIGGFFYTADKALYEKVKAHSVGLPHLDKQHQERLFSQLIFERGYCSPESYPKIAFLRYMKSAIGRLLNRKKGSVFLDLDYQRRPSAVYPYPSKLPPFLAYIGLTQLQRWKDECSSRKALLSKYLAASERLGLKKIIPKVYFNGDVDIIPLRFVYTHPLSAEIESKMSRFVDTSYFWFRSPVICLTASLEDIGYLRGSCPESEETGKFIINWPCVMSKEWQEKAVDVFEEINKSIL